MMTRSTVKTIRTFAISTKVRSLAFGVSGLILALSPLPALGQTLEAHGWITSSDAAPNSKPIILHFRRQFDLSKRPLRYPVRVSADNRFILYANGVRIADGPSTGDVTHWREETVDLAPYLRAGRNVVAAVVWDGVKPLQLPVGATQKQIDGAEGASLFTNTAPLFQQSVATGFHLIGIGDAAAISTDHPGWRAKRDQGHGFANGWAQTRRWYYVAGNPEIIDAAKATFDAAGPNETGDGWHDAIPAPAAAARNLVADQLPPQSYQATHVGTVVRSDLAGTQAFPAHAVTVPANSKVKLLIQRDVMVSAYPELEVSGGKDAKIDITWSEALYDENFRKGDRNLIGDRKPFGPHDSFIADGNHRVFAPLWWRTWRYAEIVVETRDQPLILQGLRAHATGYPFVQVGRFASDDPDLARIFDVGWRTASLDAHETYMDTAFWEQLQYAGDTRLQMLISYAVSGDPRLARQAIDSFASSDVDGGLMEAAYPTRGHNIIAPFSLMWIGMLDDWRSRQPDTKLIVDNLPRMRRVLAWWMKYKGPNGLQLRNPHWNFVDWAGQAATDRDQFPSFGKEAKESCLLSVLWLGALQQAARLEMGLGDHGLGSKDLAEARDARDAIRSRCWVPARGLYADNPDGTVFSQHMNALAVLYDVATPTDAKMILERIVVPGKGINAPEGMLTTSYYFSWYLAQAFAHAGEADKYLGLLKTWRDLLKMNYTTWPEERDGAGQTGTGASTRSDSHAWSAHPTADLLGLVAGIAPGSAGYASVRIAPALGGLTHLEATAATPKGPVRVSYLVKGHQMTALIKRPRNLPGEFIWQGKRYRLARPTTRLTLVVKAKN